MDASARRAALLVGGIAGLGLLFAAVALLLYGRVEPTPPVAVDERGGRVGPVALGDSEAEVRSALPEAGSRDGFAPAGAAYTGPVSIPAPGGRPPKVLATADVAVLVDRLDGAYAVTTVADGSATRLGVAVGAALGEARRAYPDATCGDARTEGTSYRWCRARVGDVAVFFGGDPIASVTLTALR